jgi:hypothetical protein
VHEIRQANDRQRLLLVSPDDEGAVISQGPGDPGGDFLLALKLALEAFAPACGYAQVALLIAGTRKRNAAAS